MTASAADRSPGEKVKMTVSERTAESLTPALRDWLASRLGTGEPPEISNVRVPEFGGLSSTSVLFEAHWTIGGKQSSGAYVARMAPEASAVPVFPRYDLPGQYDLIAQVAKRCGVPLPALRWNEPGGGPLGTPFFVMDQVQGRVPLDNPPYVFGGWLHDASPAERAALQRDSVAILAALHAIGDAGAGVPRAGACRRAGLATGACRRAAAVLPVGAGWRRDPDPADRAEPFLARRALACGTDSRRAELG